MMREWDAVFPAYGLASHKGYSTPQHLAALKEHGPTPLHRQSFAPVWQNPVPQESFAFMDENDPIRLPIIDVLDLHTFAPTVVFVEHCDPLTHPCFALENLSFDTLAWFQRSPAFAAEWHNYRLQQTALDFDVYTRTSPSSH